MKYFPLLWATLWRRAARTVLTLLSVTAAFTLFGLMLGLSASFTHIVELARVDRIYVDPRFGGSLPAALRDQIAHIDGVTQIGYTGWLGGYYRDPKNVAGVMMNDRGMQQVRTEIPLTPPQIAALNATPAGIYVSRLLANRWHLKAGDIFPLIAPQTARADGAKSWAFNILGVADDIPAWPTGYMIGNYDYYDKARVREDQGKASWFEVLIRDPGRAIATSRTIDRLFANSNAPTSSMPEKAMYQGGSQSGGIDIALVTQAIAAAGLFMILFLTANGIAQSVRERRAEFAVMKTLGFSNGAVMGLVFLEAAIPCITGAALGVALATALSSFVPRIVPAGWGIPLPTMSPEVLALAIGLGMAVALIGAVVPALRIMRLDIATALSGPAA